MQQQQVDATARFQNLKTQIKPPRFGLIENEAYVREKIKYRCALPSAEVATACGRPLGERARVTLQSRNQLVQGRMSLLSGLYGATGRQN